MTGKKTLTGFGLLLCGTDATTISNAKKPCTAVTSRYDVNELLSCFLLLPPSQRSRCQAKCRAWSQASAEDGWSIFFPKNGSVSNCTSFAQVSQAPGTPINSKPWFMAQSWAERNKSRSYVESNNVTHSECMTSHHDHKFTVVEKTSN